MVKRIAIAHPEEARIFARRAQFINRELAILTSGLAIGSATSDAPVLFAHLSALFVLLLCQHFDRPFHRIFKLWREEQHSLVQARLVWRSYIPFVVAWLALGIVAAGFVNNSGLVLR